MSPDVVQALLFGFRSTIGPSQDMTIGPVSSNLQLIHSGAYVISNLGPSVVFLQIHPDSGTFVATVADYPLAPIGSGEWQRTITIGDFDVKQVTPGGGHPRGRNVIHAITAGGASVLRITQVTRK